MDLNNKDFKIKGTLAILITLWICILFNPLIICLCTLDWRFMILYTIVPLEMVIGYAITQIIFKITEL
jgi:hypothetical protein